MAPLRPGGETMAKQMFKKKFGGYFNAGSEDRKQRWLNTGHVNGGPVKHLSREEIEILYGQQPARRFGPPPRR